MAGIMTPGTTPEDQQELLRKKLATVNDLGQQLKEAQAFEAETARWKAPVVQSQENMAQHGGFVQSPKIVGQRFLSTWQKKDLANQVPEATIHGPGGIMAHGFGRTGIENAKNSVMGVMPKRDTWNIRQGANGTKFGQGSFADKNGVERRVDNGQQIFRDAFGNRITQAQARMNARDATPEARARAAAGTWGSREAQQRRYDQAYSGIMAQQNNDRNFAEGQRQFDANTATTRTKNEQDFELGKLQSNNQLEGTKHTNDTNKAIQAGHDTASMHNSDNQLSGIMHQSDNQLWGTMDTNAANKDIATGHDEASMHNSNNQLSGIMHQSDNALAGTFDTNDTNKTIQAGHDAAQLDSAVINGEYGLMGAAQQGQNAVNAIKAQGTEERDTIGFKSDLAQTELANSVVQTPQGQRLKVGNLDLDEGQTRMLLDQVQAARDENGNYDRQKLHAIAAQYGMTSFWDNDRWFEQLSTLGQADYAKRYGNKPSPVTPVQTQYKVQ